MPQSHTLHFLHQRRVFGRVVVQADIRGLPPALPAWVRQAVAASWLKIPAFKAAPWQFTLRIASAAVAQAANQQFRAKAYTPDVLSFPLWDTAATPTYAGDIMLGWPKVEADALAQGKPLKAHLQHLVVHAMLHLGGHDHHTKAEATRMEAQEIAILRTLNWPNPYEIV